MNAIGNLFTGLSFIGLVILVPPFVWHIKNVNLPAVFLIFWLLFSNLTGFVDAIIWSGDDFYDQYDGRGLCDVTIKLKLGSVTGKLCAVSALSLQLFMILRANNLRFMNNRTKFKIIFDCVFCLTTPVIIMSLSYLVQGARIGVLRYYGCSGIYYSWVYLVIQSSMMLMWSLVATVLAVLTVYTYFRKKIDVKDILKCTNSGLNLKRFARLLIFSSIIILTLTPLSIYTFVGDVTTEQFRMRYNFHFIHNPLLWNYTYFVEAPLKILYFRWIDIGLSIITFLIFGIGTDAIELYKSILIRCGLGKIFRLNTLEDIDRFPSNISNDNTTKSPTNQTTKSQLSAGSNITGSTFIDGLEEFHELINDDDDDDDDDDEKVIPKVFTVDLEKGCQSEHDAESKEIEYFINGDHDGTDITYSYNITKHS
ncbi:pheromone a factor receptor [[Candida] jaroonii]|uniref:Pheromone a factor receptor n=1 Tax=[Candida] jaroonii TaxID=467808 RepID=A0ACA9Y3M5_9ASCO|nr:pheromone a factor receptor [[Candida] jaroonii]